MKIGTIIKVKKKWCKVGIRQVYFESGYFGNRNAVVFDLSPAFHDYGVMFPNDISKATTYYTIEEKDIKEIIWTP